MAYVAPLAEEDLDPPAKELIEGDTERFGYTPNFIRVLARRPAAYAAWLQLNGAIKAQMDERRYELVTLAAARRLRSSYCMLAHGQVLHGTHLETDELRAVAEDHRSAGLDEVEVALMDLGEKIADDATAVGQADIDRLRGLGLSDGEIIDAVMAAAGRCFFSKTLDALGLEPDASYNEMEPDLRAALTVGRPIESG